MFFRGCSSSSSSSNATYVHLWIAACCLYRNRLLEVLYHSAAQVHFHLLRVHISLLSLSPSLRGGRVGTKMHKHLHLAVCVDVKGVEETQRGTREGKGELRGFVGREVVGEEEAERHTRAIDDHERAVDIYAFYQSEKQNKGRVKRRKEITLTLRCSREKNLQHE